MLTVRRPGRFASGLAVALVAALALTGCAAGDDADVAAPSGPEAAEPDSAPQPPAGDNAEGGSTDDSGGAAGGSLIDTRAIIYTGEVRIRVDDVSAAAREVAALAERYEGFVGGDRRSGGDDGDRATMVLRIPSSSFTAAVAELAGLGEEDLRNIHTEDVTEEVVDLETRIATAEASVERTRDLLERAESISDIVSVEEELAAREARLASLQARQRELADLTTLSTVTVSLLEHEAEVVAEEREGPDLGFVPGLSAGWKAFVSVMTVLVTLFGALLPWLVTAAVPTAAVVWWARRRRRPARPA